VPHPTDNTSNGVLSWADHLWLDLKFSMRSLGKARAFSLAIIATLALCIGANTAILSVLYGLIWKPLPFPHPEQIVDVYNQRPGTGEMKLGVGIVQYLDYKAHADLFSDFAMWSGWMFNIGEEGGTARYVGMKVTPEYFSVLGIQPMMGRVFTADEAVPGKDGVVVLTYAYWQKQFHGDPNILGQQVRLTERPYTVIGILPRTFEEVSVAPVLMVPYAPNPDLTKPQWRMLSFGSMYARIRPGVSHGAALAQLNTLERQNRELVADPAQRDFQYRGGHRMMLGQLRAEQTQVVRKGLLLLQGGAALVLLLGCINVASLMLARANARQPELAVRQALGASRLALARQLFVESGLLALAGAGVGLALAATSMRVINLYMGTIIYGIPPVSLDGGVLALTLLVTMFVALLIGVLPVLRMSRSHSLQTSVQAGSRGASRGGGIRAMSGALVIAQVALALVLLVGAGLLIRSFAKVMAISPGFDAGKVIHARVAYNNGFNDLAKLHGLQTRILEKMREIPGVDSIAYSEHLPGFAEERTTSLPLRGMPAGKDGSYPTAIAFGVSPEYFETMGIRLLEGRNFTEADQLPNARMVFIVDRKFAERYFPGRSAVGQLFAFDPKAKPETAPMIIGVAEVARVGGLESDKTAPYAYMATATPRGGLSIELRTARPFTEIMPLIRAKLREVDPSLPIYQERTMQSQLDDAAANRRGVMWLLGAFAGIALLLAAVGIYGMLAYDVTQRTKEIGIRGAIGATRGQIVTLILKQGLIKAGIGMTIGLVAAFILSRYLASLLYGVEPRDPPIFIAVTCLLLLVALLASLLPARRAARVDPMVALRCE
jgi:predicted permease